MTWEGHPRHPREINGFLERVLYEGEEKGMLHFKKQKVTLRMRQSRRDSLEKKMELLLETVYVCWIAWEIIYRGTTFDKQKSRA